MNAHDRERLEQELLELHFGCHPEPERLRTRLHEPQVAALWQRVQSLGQTLATAAKDHDAEVTPLLAPPARRSARGLWRLPAYAAAAALLITGIVGAIWGGHAWHNHRVRSESITLTVSGPQAIPHGAAASYTVRGRDVDDRPSDGAVAWRVLDKADAVLAQGSTTLAQGDASVTIPAVLAASEHLVVELTSPQGKHEVRFPLAASRAVPLVHVASDKPLYRPGEIVHLRAVALDRVALAPFREAVPLRLRVLDPRDATTSETKLLAEVARHGVMEFDWPIGEQMPGGDYKVQVLPSDHDTPLAELPVAVQRFEPPRFDKHLALDKPSYAPGGRGAAELTVTRLGGGSLAGAKVTAQLLVAGDEVWRGASKLDAQGHVRLDFALPETTRPGAARLAVTIADGAVVETAVAACTVAGGRAQVAAYPEGGDLVSGIESRVYVSATDAQGQPLDARGRIVDQTGREVTTFATSYQGLAACAFTPQADARYTVELLGAAPARCDLPTARQAGVVLRSLDDKIAAGAPLRVRLTGRGAPRVQVGVFCRGVLVGQSATSLEQSAELSIPLPDAVCGVLRVTAFAQLDAGLVPLAERLVQRAAKQRLAIELAPQHTEVKPGGQQTLRVRVRDENGAPRVTALGLAVADQSVRALADEPRVGLADQALLFGDVPHAAPRWFAAADAAQIDLLLGAAGWRRFAWRDAQAADTTPRLAQARQRDGRADTPRSDRAGDTDNHALWQAQRQVRRWSQYTASSGALGGALVVTLGLAALLVAFARRRGWSTTLPADIAFGGLASVLLVAAPLLLLQPSKDVAPAFAVEDRLQAVPQEELDTILIDGAPTTWSGSRDAFYERSLHYLAAIPKTAAGVPEQAPSLANSQTAAPLRHNFAETALWSPLLVTDARGEAEVTFHVSDRITTWRIDADAHGDGRVGQAQASFIATQPLHLEAKLPTEATEGDELQIPVAVVAKDPSIQSAELKVSTSGSVRQRDGTYQLAELKDGKGRLRVPVSIGAPGDEPSRIELEGVAGTWRDHIRQDLRVLPRGFPHARSWSGNIAGVTTLSVPMPERARRPRAMLRVFPSPLSTLREGLDGMLQEPHGCFEQASSTNYPNVLVLGYLEATGDVLPAVASRARTVLDKGYDLLVGYECRQRGYEWFGSDPGHQELTAYGLLEFTDMAKVYGVDSSMVERTRSWLMARRNGQGGFSRPAGSRHAFGSAPPQVSDAYCLWALLYSGSPAQELGPELARARERAQQSDDAYELALLANALRDAKDDAAAAGARARLATLQQADGTLRGTTTSITGSRGDDLAVETTSLAVLAWLGDDQQAARSRQALEFVQSKRMARGTFGATQATVLALRALTAYAQAQRPGKSGGTLEVRVADRTVATLAIAGDEPHAVEVDLARWLQAGDNRVTLHRGGDGAPWPYALTLSYHADQPADDPEAPLALRASVLAEQAKEGDIVIVDVELENTTSDGVAMAMAIIGLPAGLELPRHELDTLKGTGHFDFYELNGREVVLYWRGLGPNQTYRLLLATVARVPGISTGPASRTYPYYQPSAVRWQPPLRVEVK